MERKNDDSRNNDAQILARLRRRSTPSSARQDDGFSTVDASGVSASTPVSKKESRTDALKRLVASQEPKEPMSALSPTLRDLRKEFNSDPTATFAAATRDDERRSSDASLDLIEASLNVGQAETEHVSVATPNDVKIVDVNLTERKTSMAKTTDGSASFPKLSSIDVNTPKVDVNRQVEVENGLVHANASDLMIVSELRKGYVKGKKLIPVLQGVDLTVKQGELLAVVGQSGSGKSTLLHLMGTLDVPDSGTIHFDGQRIDNLPCAQRDVLRNRFIGMIFQFYHLIPEMTTLENVLAPLMIRESIWGYLRKRSAYTTRAKELLALVGLSHRLRHRPNELSGGEMQRVSIARALITDPRVLLADEPTGNLDSKASIEILKLLRRLNQEQNLTVVMVTHDMSQAKDSDRAIRLVDGMVVPE